MLMLQLICCMSRSLYSLPHALYMVRKLLAVDRDGFQKYVVCPKCTKCYEYNDCVKVLDGHHVVKQCNSKFYKRGKV